MKNKRSHVTNEDKANDPFVPLFNFADNKHFLFLAAMADMDSHEFQSSFYFYIDKHRNEISNMASESIVSKKLLKDLLKNRTVKINLFTSPETYIEQIIMAMYVELERYEKAALYRDIIKMKANPTEQ